MGKGKQSPVWKYFYKGDKYKNNRYNYEVWCMACVDAKVRPITHTQLLEQSSGQRESVEKEEDIRQRGANDFGRYGQCIH